MAMSNGCMHQQAGGVHMRHDGHQIDGLMIGRLVDLQRVDETTVIVAGVRNSPDDCNRDTLDADPAIQTVDRANQAGRVTRRQLQEIFVETLLVVGVTMKEDFSDLILLSSLEDGFLAVLYVQLLILCAHAR